MDRSLDKMPSKEEGEVEYQASRYDNLPRVVKIIFLVLTIAGVGLDYLRFTG
ncbi:unnamed protein product, partial [marine sediment metagenome]